MSYKDKLLKNCHIVSANTTEIYYRRGIGCDYFLVINNDSKKFYKVNRPKYSNYNVVKKYQRSIYASFSKVLSNITSNKIKLDWRLPSLYLNFLTSTFCIEITRNLDMYDDTNLYKELINDIANYYVTNEAVLNFYFYPLYAEILYDLMYEIEDFPSEIIEQIHSGD